MQASQDDVNGTFLRQAPAVRFLQRLRPENFNELLLTPLVGETLTVGLLKAGDIAAKFMNHAHESPMRAGLSVAIETVAEILVPTAVHAGVTLTMKALKHEEEPKRQASPVAKPHQATTARKIANAVGDFKKAAFVPPSLAIA